MKKEDRRPCMCYLNVIDKFIKQVINTVDTIETRPMLVQ